MKIDFSQGLKEHSGVDVKDQKTGEAFLLRDAAVYALDVMMQGEKPIEGPEKYKRDHLASRIYGAKEPVVLNIDELKLVKDRIGIVYGPRIVHEGWDLLDPRDAPDEPRKEPTLAIPSGK